MSTKVRAVNSFFKTAIKPEVDRLKENIILTDRQDTIFTMYYLQGKDTNYIADTLFVSLSVVCRELKTIRAKIMPYL